MKNIIYFSIFLLSIMLGHAEKVRPNVLIIMADDLGYGDLSSYGAKDMRTPHLDKLMSESMRFDDFHANSCVCSPTRAALISGRYPELVGVPGVIRHYKNGDWGHLDPNSTMLTNVFQKNGYYTSLIGKWHLGLTAENLPNQRGFDEFHGWLGDMMDDYWKHTRAGQNFMRLNAEKIQPTGHATDLFTEWSIASIERRAKEGKPWFQFLAYNAPHDPIQPPPECLEKVKQREPGIDDKRAGLVALIEHMDDGIGKVLAALEKSGQDKKTIVVFTSDNGGDLKHAANNGPLRDGKGHFYDGGTKVPTSIRWSGKIPAAKTQFRALTMDILPTIADLCEVPIESKLEGQSFKQQLLTGKQPAFDRPEHYMWLQKTTKQAMRLGDWKIIRDDIASPVELYNLKTDTLEANNLSAKEPERLKQMTDAMDAHLAAAKLVPWQAPAK
ncbi:MAG: sulfatase [Akkermansiaceae bacterium]|jgi:arylsulfatase A-like enzyme